jgi:hypothetical protein
MKTLEGHKLFPYIAWITVILFSFFTYSLVLDLKASVNALEQKTEQTEMQLQKTKTVH